MKKNKRITSTDKRNNWKIKNKYRFAKKQSRDRLHRKGQNNYKMEGIHRRPLQKGPKYFRKKHIHRNH